MEILSGGCEGQRWTRRARPAARSGRDVGGRVSWRGCEASKSVPEREPPLTPLGKQLWDRNKSESRGVLIADSNDPHLRYCDPFGFPRNMNEQIRAMTLTTRPDRTFVLVQFQTIWREIWMDGLTLPTNFSRRGGGLTRSDVNGYSVGRWEDDYTFVAETTGMAPETWATEAGHPHSVEARVTERFHRPSKNDLTVTTTMDDPTLYTRPLKLGEIYFRWIPSQTFFNTTCIPSSLQRYLKEMADPAGNPVRRVNPFANRPGIYFWRCMVKPKVLMIMVLVVGFAAIDRPSFAHHGGTAFDITQAGRVEGRGDYGIPLDQSPPAHQGGLQGRKGQRPAVDDGTGRSGGRAAHRLDQNLARGWRRRHAVRSRKAKTGALVGRFNKVDFPDGTTMRDSQTRRRRRRAI